MTLEEIIARLEELCPPQFAVSWDNSGLQAGRYEQEVKTVCLAVDATSEAIAFAAAQGADLLITHHPLLFSGIKSIHDHHFIGKRVMELIRNDISCYAMHTNFDVMGMADAAADLLRLEDREVLEVTYEDEVSKEGIGRIGRLPEHMKLDDFAALVRDAFRLESVRVYGNPSDTIVTAAVLPGSGKEEYLKQKEFRSKVGKLQNELKRCETAISKLESESAELEKTMSEPEIASDHIKLAELYAKKSADDEQMLSLLTRIDEISSELKALGVSTESSGV